MRLFSPRLCFGIWLSTVVFMLGLSVVDSVCKKGWMSIGSKPENCFRLFSNTKGSFNYARQICRNQGGYMARDTSSITHAALVKSMNAARKLSGRPNSFWIGLTDNNNDKGPWTWAEGPALSTKAYWRRAPRNTRNKQDCAYMYTYGKGLWKTTSYCSSRRSVICQMDPGNTSGTTVAPKKIKCPVNWVAYPAGNTCLYLSKKSKTQAGARAICRALSGDLVKITDATMNGFLQSVISKSPATYYIGLTDMGTEKKFVWNDETTATTYKNFLPGQPDNWRQKEDCVVIQPSLYKWNDLSCSNYRRFICQGPTLNKPADSTSCDDGWIPYKARSTCLYFSLGKRNYWGARQSCRSQRSDLVKIPDLSTNEFVRGFVSDRKANFLIGLSDRLKEKQFVWNDETKQASFTRWDAHQPNNLGGKGQDCTSMRATNGKWWDVKCSDTSRFICEKPFNKMPTTTSGPPQSICPKGWIAYSLGSTCLFLSSKKLSYTSARSDCKKQSGDMVKITDKNMNAFIGNLIRGKGDHRLGLIDRKREGTFVWNDETYETKYENWLPNEPNNYRSGEDCVVMTSYGTYGWNDHRCYARTKYICQKGTTDYVSATPARPRSTPAPCPPGWIYYAFGKTCLRMFKTKKMSKDARADCKRQNSDLVKITGLEMNTFIISQMKPTDACFIGLHDRTRENYFTWNDEPYLFTSYTNWAKGEPNDFFQEDCVSIYPTGKWNDFSCTSLHSYICQKDPSGTLKTTTAAPKTTPSANCGPGWEEDKSSVYCYQFRTTFMSWIAAEFSCRTAGGHLASIGSSDQQSYLTGRSVSFKYNGFWIGGNDRRSEGGYGWIDRTPFAFINWGSDQPNNKNNQDCVAMVPGKGLWYDIDCTDKHPFICSKIGKRKPPTLAPKTSPASVPSGKQWGCPPLWLPYKNSCYGYFLAKSGKSWTAARKYCQTEHRADLVSIADRAENNFIYSGFHRIPRKSRFPVWIGLNDATKERTFAWSDTSPVTFTYWERHNPNNINNQDCVMMQPWNGRWNDVHCTKDSQKLFVCESYKTVRDKISTELTDGCNKGTFGYGAKCYRFVSSPSLNFLNAENYCVANGNGHLATVNDRYVQAFLGPYMKKYSGSAFWIGLNSNAKNEYAWQSGKSVDFTFWGKDHTGKKKNTCVGMQTTSPVGLWNNYDCLTSQKAICEYPRTGYTEAPIVTTTPSAATCPKTWVSKGTMCYKAFAPKDNTTDLLSWRQARDQCGTFAQGGTLVSITSQDIASVLQKSITSAKLDHTKGYWIGLSDIDKEGGFKWTDGSPWTFNLWASMEPNDYAKSEDCAEANMADGTWNDVNCNVARNYICQFQRGSQLLTPAPTVSIGPEGGKCGDSKWTYFKNYCYYISDNGTSTWFEARDLCFQMKSDLTSITSADENALLTTLSTQNSINDFWIGMTDIDSGVHKWVDRRIVSYVSWGFGEPNDYGGMERCVHMTNIGSWNDQNCNQKYGYICKKYPGQRYVRKPQPIPWGGCPTGFSTHRKATHCYQLFKSPGSFYVSQKRCAALATGGTLATISNQFEQDFISTLFMDIKTPIWIGLTNQPDSKQYQWLDNSIPTYVNWMKNAPSGPTSKYRTYPKCVSLQTGHNTFGKWQDSECYRRNPMVCQAPKNTILPDKSPDKSACNEDYTFFGNSCYQLITNSSYTWRQAEDKCNMQSGHLASITSGPEAAFFNIFTASVNSTIWLGLKFENASELFKWSDGWPVSYAPWAPDQPIHSVSDNTICVGIDNPNSTWSSYDCTSKYPFVCEMNFGTPPPPYGFIYGACQDDWIYYNGYCYFVQDKERNSHAWANMDCKIKGGQLASILTKDENDFRLSLSPRNRFSGLWIGLQKGLTTGLTWDDGSPVDYTSFTRYPRRQYPDRGEYEECYTADASSKYWRKTGCSGFYGYICKTLAKGYTAKSNAPGLSMTMTTLSSSTNPKKPVTKSTMTMTTLSSSTNPKKPVTKSTTTTSIKVSANPPAVTTSNAVVTGRSQKITSGVVTAKPTAITTSKYDTVVTGRIQKRTSDDDSKSGLGGGAIAGIILGVMTLIAIVVVAIFFVRQGSAATLINRFRRTPADVTGIDNVMYANDGIRQDKFEL